ncbi:DUF6191 domain-containing protein [Angustibacter sp. Root456]|uniref:DUF6191 domain-containing protein n=1 Tax=Angustibacter sp. Root456 TaxID=1736539 RepID=UPI0006F5B855|nr:DUF6191 domain-containing protein [Angustibacter sp. Root456]KQX63715.1 hypothetical protein ASD06_11460 [Angustibacter sp. Root456]
MELDGFIEIFQPGYKHWRQERDRKRIEAQIPETGAPPFGIDLDAGTAVIPRPHHSPTARPQHHPSRPVIMHASACPGVTPLPK